ncbi:SnodProt1 [Sanghuangporus baumii]|uniref:SnodProt1 n=1 Tax=Sanghuangporus baumii TaxID=108892 RepID=A0A9Q5HXD1_SANBA|nr:SnodProt1 [Sanghuangporus baumii]
MNFTTLFTTLLFATAAFAVRAGFDNTYDDADASMNIVVCSDGANGLASRFPTFGSVPTFPNIGGASAIPGWNSPQCGTCWQLTYSGTGNSIFVTAIDHADDGFNLSQEALDTLTNGRAVEFGVVDVTATQVDSSACGL